LYKFILYTAPTELYSFFCLRLQKCRPDGAEQFLFSKGFVNSKSNSSPTPFLEKEGAFFGKAEDSEGVKKPLFSAQPKRGVWGESILLFSKIPKGLLCGLCVFLKI
jgi:hypothetical protein